MSEAQIYNLLYMLQQTLPKGQMVTIEGKDTTVCYDRSYMNIADAARLIHQEISKANQPTKATNPQ